MGIGSLFLGVKLLVYDANHSAPSSAGVKNSGAVPLLLLYLYGVDMDSFNFLCVYKDAVCTVQLKCDGTR
jgi:hypothetical protein